MARRVRSWLPGLDTVDEDKVLLVRGVDGQLPRTAIVTCNMWAVFSEEDRVDEYCEQEVLEFNGKHKPTSLDGLVNEVVDFECLCKMDPVNKHCGQQLPVIRGEKPMHAGGIGLHLAVGWASLTPAGA